MDETLIDFVRVLRNAELRVSPAETLDALHAARAVGIEQREILRHALAVSLAKTPAEKDVFEHCFDDFFSRRGLDAAALADPEEPAVEELEELLGRPAEADATASDAALELAPLSRLLLGGDQGQLAQAIAGAGRQAGLDQIRFFTQKGQYTRRLFEAMGLQGLDRDIHALEQVALNRHPGRSEAERLRLGRQRLWDQVGDYVERNYLLYAKQNELELRDAVLRNARLSNLERRDLARLRLLVQRIARRLAARYSRRRRVSRRGQLAIARTLRAGVATDGILFERHWRSHRKDRPVVLVLCDISGSVRAYARFLLLFLYSLNEVLPRIRSFVFCAELNEVSELFAELTPEQAIDTALAQFATGSTDYGQALRGLLANGGRSLDQGATLIVLGDARNNYGDPALEAMREIGRRTRRLLWLNPELPSSWQSGDSEMLRYAPYCSDLRSCQNLRDLERFAADLLRQTS